MNYITNIIAAINGQKVVIGSVLTFVLTVLLPGLGVHPNLSSDDLLTWALSLLNYTSEGLGAFLFVWGLVHKFKKGEINLVALLNALANRKAKTDELKSQN